MDFSKLNLPYNPVRIRRVSDKSFQLWDRCRHKWLEATPEEWVRQNFIAYLIENLHYPEQFIRQEFPVNVNGQSQRADIVVFDSMGNPWLLVECKSTSVALSEDVIMQAARYNMEIHAPYLVVTNGLQHKCFGLNQMHSEMLVPCSMPKWL